MKKLLSFLLSFSSVSAFASSIPACKFGQFVKEQENTEQKFLALKNKFISEVKSKFKLAMTTSSKNMFHFLEDEDESFNENYLKSNFFKQKLVTNEDAYKIIRLSSEEQTGILEELFKIINIQEIIDALHLELMDIPEYSVFLNRDIPFFNTPSINPEVIIKRQTYNGNEVYTLEFQFAISFNFMVNNIVEKSEDIVIGFYYSIYEGELFKILVEEHINNLPANLWNNYLSALQFDEKRLSTNNFFLDQTTNLQTYLNSLEPAEHLNLKKIIYDEITGSLAEEINMDIKVNDFELNSLSSERIYKEQEVSQVILEGGFIEQAVFLKGNNNLSNEEIYENKKKSFLDEFPRFDLNEFVNDSIFSIKTYFGVDIKLNSQQLEPFIEYGSITIDNLKVTIGKMVLDINPINLLYTYKPTVEIEDSLIKLLTQWQTSWNITEATNPAAMWKIRETNDDGESIPLAVEFWSKVSALDFHEFGYNFTADMFEQSLFRTGFSNFFVKQKDEFLYSWLDFDSKGLFVWTAGNKPTAHAALDRLWKPVFIIDDMTFSINLVRLKKYEDFIWNPLKESRYIIERT